MSIVAARRVALDQREASKPAVRVGNPAKWYPEAIAP
jgi:hypothetical protein